MVHNHKPLTMAADDSAEKKAEAATDYEFVGQTCPGLRPGDGKIDWQGCDMDAREIIVRGENKEYSQIWSDVLLKTC